MMHPDGIKKAYRGLMHLKAMLELAQMKLFRAFFYKSITNRLHMDRPTDRPMDGHTSYRDARTHLKTHYGIEKTVYCP